MKPQSKVTIFMVVMIVMLSIYYFTLPNKPVDDSNNTGDTVVVEREFDPLREELQSVRETMYQQLNATLASTDSTVEEKNLAYETINTLQELTQNELLLETKIIDLGYEDTFVSATTNQVNISVFVDDLSAQQANQIWIMAKTQFGLNCDIVLEYVPKAVN